MTHTLPESLVDAVARRRCVIYVGAGASAGAVSANGLQRPPTWQVFLHDALRHHSGTKVAKRQISKLLRQNDFLTAAEMLKLALNEKWYELMADAFSRPMYSATDVHKLLFKLDSRIVLTPNFDKIYDVYAQQETGGATQIKQYWDGDILRSLRGDYRLVVKVHGSVDDTTKMIFTRSEYAQFRSRYPAFHDLVDALFLTHTFFFVGSSLNDPDLRLFLERHAYTHPRAPPHYMIKPNTEVDGSMIQLVKNNYNLHCITYAPTDNHLELQRILADLAGKVDDKRVEVQQNSSW